MKVQKLFLFMLAVSPVLTGCLAEKSEPLAGTATPPPPVAAAKPEKPSDKPYKLVAAAQGMCVSFALNNTSSQPMEIDPNDFALIPKGSRQVIPYDAENVTLEAPKSVSPGETVLGRVVFKDVSSPAGSRLVFKPDAEGTFAPISAGELIKPTVASAAAQAAPTLLAP